MKELLVTPESLKEIELNTDNMPDVYDGYLYKYTDLDTGRMYIGVHKGSVTDSYWHSSTDKEFQELLSNPNSNFRYEILEYGDYAQMTVMEHQALKLNDARNNPLYFNKTNGSPLLKTLNHPAIDSLIDRIESGEFDCGWENIDDLYELKRLQVRSSEYSKTIKDIAEWIDDRNGDLSKADRIVIYEELMEGDDVVGDGTHTIGGIHKSKHGKKAPVARISREVIKDFSNAELRAVSNRLNKISDKKKNEMTKDDAVKWLVGVHNSGVKIEEYGNIQYLKKCGFSINSIGTIMKNANHEIDKNNLKLKDQVWIDYSTKDGRSILDSTCENLRDINTIAFYTSSTLIRWNSILRKIMATISSDSKVKYPKEESHLPATQKTLKHHITMVIHHTNSDEEEKFESETRSEMYGWFKHFLGELGYTFNFKVMDTTRINMIV